MEAKTIAFKECERQAKFGYEPSWEDFVIAGQKAGIREVVEWIEEQRGVGGLVDRRKEWQAQKKVWGIDDGNT